MFGCVSRLLLLLTLGREGKGEVLVCCLGISTCLVVIVSDVPMVGIWRQRGSIVFLVSVDLKDEVG